MGPRQIGTELGEHAATSFDGRELVSVADQDRLDPNVTGARGHRIGVGDLILTRRNDPTIDLRRPNGSAGSVDSVRNGNRWRVAAIDQAANRVTADTTHAVLGENTTRSLLYVAMTRGRHTNTTHLYQRATGDSEYGYHDPDGTHLAYRGDSGDAANLIRAIRANPDQTPVTAHDYAAHTLGAALPDRIRSLLNRRTTSAHRRRATYETWRTDAENHAQSMSRTHERAASKSRDRFPHRDVDGLPCRGQHQHRRTAAAVRGGAQGAHRGGLARAGRR